MFSLLRNAPIAFALAAAFAATAPASAQIELTQQEYYKLRVLASEDEAGLRSLLRAIDELPPALEDMLLAFQRDLLTRRDAADYMYRRYGATLDQRSDFAPQLANGILTQTEILVAGIFRLPMEDQERYLDFVVLTFDEVAIVEPQICGDILTEDLSPIDYARIDYFGYRALGEAGLAEMLALYWRALEAEFEGRTPAVEFTRDQLGQGEAALEEAALAVFETSPLAERIGAAENLEDIADEDVCALTSLVFDALETLGQPQRSWALRAALAEGGF